MYRRRPAGGNDERINGDLAFVGATIAANGHGRHAQTTGRIVNAVAHQHLDAERPRLIQQPPIRVLAAIDDGGDLHAGLLQVESRFIG